MKDMAEVSGYSVPALMYILLSDDEAERIYYGESINAANVVESLARRTAKPFVFASPFHILALASVIDKPIYSVYPDIPTAARIKQALHFLFYPRRMLTANSNRIFENPWDIFFPIMWSKMHRTTLHGWEPNHFVPLVTRSEFIQKYSNSSVSYSSAVKIKRATRGPKPFIPSKRVKKN